MGYGPIKEIISTIQSIKIMEEQKDKRVFNIELGNEVKKVSITGKDSDEKVVMRQELSEDELKLATGGMPKPRPTHYVSDKNYLSCPLG